MLDNSILVILLCINFVRKLVLTLSMDGRNRAEAGSVAHVIYS